ncbi:MAG: hypothetical protein ACXVCT_20195, partial [Ktedonobacterales bacterium]
LGSIPMVNPFPVTLALSEAATVAFGAELVIGKLWVHPRKWLYVLVTGCVVLGVLFMAWSGYYAFFGPYEVEPRLSEITHIPNPWYAFYASILIVNIAIVLVTLILVSVIGILLWRQKS